MSLKLPKNAVSAFLFMILASLVVGDSSLASDTTTYEYDALGRLKKVTLDNGDEIDYDYDAAGNRQSKSMNGSGGSSNSPPNAVNDSAFLSGTFSNYYLNAINNDSDPDGDTLTITAVTQPSNAIVTIHTSSTLRIFSVSSGTSTFTYTISDGNGGTDSATVTVTVAGGGGGPPL